MAISIEKNTDKKDVSTQEIQTGKEAGKKGKDSAAGREKTERGTDARGARE